MRFVSDIARPFRVASMLSKDRSEVKGQRSHHVSCSLQCITEDEE